MHQLVMVLISLVIAFSRTFHMTGSLRWDGMTKKALTRDDGDSDELMKIKQGKNNLHEEAEA